MAETQPGLNRGALRRSKVGAIPSINLGAFDRYGMKIVAVHSTGLLSASTKDVYKPRKSAGASAF